MEGEKELYDQTFVDTPAILDKHKGAAAVADRKYPHLIYTQA